MYATKTHVRAPLRIVIVERLAIVPVPIYGGTLALLGLNLLISITWPDTRGALWLSVLWWMAGITLLAALATHVAKAVLAADAFRSDLCNPAVAPFFGQIGIALALLCESISGSNPAFASLAFQGSAMLALLGLGHAIWLMKMHRPSWREASPAWMLPSLQWLYLGVLAHQHAPMFRNASLTLGWLLAVPVCIGLALRTWRGPHWPKPVRPALAIFLALPAIMLLALLQEQRPSPILITFFFIITLTACSRVLIFFLQVVRQSFRISWWAYGMPLSAAAISLRVYADYRNSTLWLILVAKIICFLSIAITSGLILTSVRAIQRFIFLPSREMDR